MPNQHRNTLLVRSTVLAAVFVASWFWAWSGPGLCIFHHLTGLDCPGCGMTRAFHALSHGNPGEAWTYNIFSPFLFVFFFLVLAHDMWQLLSNSEVQVRIPETITKYGMYGILAAVVTYGIIRNIPSIA
ncbi:MAG: DUF2752 domain-containing protein [Chloroflexota bacterium]|nr:DUF2752 domain-containing protein [Chloroflexota bacterium]